MIGSMPDGGHKCKTCLKSVHALPGCSISCGEPEGYGQKRECISCANKSSSGPINHQSVQDELNTTEKWSKGRRKTRSSYLNPVPNWNLDQRVQSRPTISILSNASNSALTHNVNGRTVALRNTSGFDSNCQVVSLSLQYYRST